MKRGSEQNSADRRLQCFELRKQGYSYREIGRELGISEAQSHRDVKRVMVKLEKLTLDSAVQYREMELERLDTLYKVSYDQAIAGDLAALDRCLKISEARRKLLGLDAPVQSEVAIAPMIQMSEPLTPTQYQALTHGNSNGTNN